MSDKLVWILMLLLPHSFGPPASAPVSPMGPGIDPMVLMLFGFIEVAILIFGLAMPGLFREKAMVTDDDMKSLEAFFGKESIR